MRKFLLRLWRRITATVDRLEYPYEIFLTAADVALMKSCNIIFPYSRGASSAGEVAVPLTYLELSETRNAVMGLAQVAIGVAARRQLSTLPRRAHALGLLAAYLHAVWMRTPEAVAERALVDNVIHFPAESGKERALSS